MSKSGRKFWYIVVCVLLLGAAPQAAAQEQVLGQRFQLPNGLVWLFSHQSDLPLVTLDLTVKAGALFDPPGKEGLANVTASLLRYGTKTRTAQQIAEDIDFLGMAFSTGAGRDVANIKLTVIKKELQQGLKIFQDVLMQPRFAPADLQSMTQRFRGALKSQEDEPGVVAERAFRRTLFGNHPYGFPVLGTAESLARLTRNDVSQFHRRYYGPNNAILTIVGDLTLEEAQKIVEEMCGAWEAVDLPAPPPAPAADRAAPQVVRLNKEITQANILLGEMSLKRTDPDFYAFQLMNYILGGGGFSSRLMDNIRENRGLVYNVHSSFEPGLEAGPFDISLETKNASGGQAVTEVLQELDRVRNELVSDKELADAKAYLINSLPMKMDSNAKRAALLGYVELFGLGLDYPWRYPEILGKITRDDILSAARKHLDPEKYVLVVVGKQAEISLTLPAPWHDAANNPPKGEPSR